MKALGFVGVQEVDIYSTSVAPSTSERRRFLGYIGGGGGEFHFTGVVLTIFWAL